MDSPALSAETEKFIELMFPAEEVDGVRKSCFTIWYDKFPWSSADPERLHFAILKLSDGDLERLRDAKRIAITDFRDALVWAGFADLGSYKNWRPEARR